MSRLSVSNLPVLPDSIDLPEYDREALGIGIVHLGLGAFHRAHQAVYTDDVLAKVGGAWRIDGVSLRSPDVAWQLNPQDGLYSVNVKSAQRSDYRVIGAIGRVFYAPEDPGAVIDRMADPAIRIVSLTVTEKGYCHDPATGKLKRDHPAIAADLAQPEAPHSAPGYIVAALARRRAAAEEPFTVLCCDNLPNNGSMVRRVVTEHASLRSDGLASWIENSVTFPATMIDRIVPATTPADKAAARAALGVDDEALVVTEPFTQWVIEDAFRTDRPAWEQVGAEFVSDVAPFELAKLRMLNGSHSTIAYLGYLAGYEYVYETIADPDFRRFIDAMMKDEIAPTIPSTPGLDLDAYRETLVERFANPALEHRNWQIAMDGSQKLPQRLLGTIRDRLSYGGTIDRLALAVAGWMRYVGGRDECDQPIEVSDPLKDELAERTRNLVDAPDEAISRLLALEEVFGNDLPRNREFRAAVTGAVKKLLTDGTRSVVRITSRQ